MPTVLRRADTLGEDSHRIPALDGIRGIAILLVMFIHFTERNVSAGLANSIYTQLAGVGWIGVDLFFVLSGFLITGLLLDSKGAPHYFRNFYARRTLRIFPLYYACLLVWLVAVPWLAPPSWQYGQGVLATLEREQAWYWTYLSNWRMGLDGEWPGLGISVYWSLAIEEQFYLIWPAVVRFCSVRMLRRIALALIGAAFAARLAMVYAGAQPILVYVSTPTRMDALALGALVAIAMRDPAAWLVAKRIARRVWPFAVLCLLAIWASIGEFSEYHPLMQTLGFPALAVLFGSLMVHAVTADPGSRLSNVLTLRVLTVLGKYSYAMYLVHLTLRVFLVSSERARMLVEWGGVGVQLALLAAFTAVTVFVGWLSWHLFERHFLALKRYFTTQPALAGHA